MAILFMSETSSELEIHQFLLDVCCNKRYPRWSCVVAYRRYHGSWVFYEVASWSFFNEKWFTPNDLVLASFYKTSPQVFTFLEMCNPYEFMNLANFSLSKMTYRCSNDSLFWASPLTCETRSWESVLNLSLFPHLNGQCDVDDKRFILSLIISDRKPYTGILRSSSQLHFLGWTQLNFNNCWIPIYTTCFIGIGIIDAHP